MKAAIGDRVIVQSPTTGALRREGEIIALHHADGTPPYDVRWSDTGRIALVYPGPDAHVRHVHHLHAIDDPGDGAHPDGQGHGDGDG